MIRSVLAVITLCVVFNSDCVAADVAAGKSVATRQCKECHDADGWEGEDAASLASIIRDIMSGKVKHKRPIQLSDADIENIAAYWARGQE